MARRACCVGPVRHSFNPTVVNAQELSPDRVYVEGTAEAAEITHWVEPKDPEANVHGDVILDAVIGKDGRVESLKVVSGHPLLIPAALDAVRQWHYLPHRLNGGPVEVETEIVVNFSPRPSQRGRSGETIIPPAVFYSSRPVLSERARQADFEGTVKLSIMVGSDGSVDNVRVVKGLGMGLDEQAAKTVRTWKFHPALVNGSPARVNLLVEVTFHREKGKANSP